MSSSRRGGVEPLSVNGHLGSGEPIVKPTLKGRFLCFMERNMTESYSMLSRERGCSQHKSKKRSRGN